MAGKFVKFCLKALFMCRAFIARVAEAPADYESTNEDFRACSRDDKPVFIDKMFDWFHSKILKTGRLSNFILFLYLFWFI